MNIRTRLQALEQLANPVTIVLAPETWEVMTSNSQITAPYPSWMQAAIDRCREAGREPKAVDGCLLC
jgi:hypothetical protein